MQSQIGQTGRQSGIQCPLLPWLLLGTTFTTYFIALTILGSTASDYLCQPMWFGLLMSLKPSYQTQHQHTVENHYMGHHTQSNHMWAMPTVAKGSENQEGRQRREHHPTNGWVFQMGVCSGWKGEALFDLQRNAEQSKSFGLNPNPN